MLISILTGTHPTLVHLVLSSTIIYAGNVALRALALATSGRYSQDLEFDALLVIEKSVEGYGADTTGVLLAGQKDTDSISVSDGFWSE